MKMMLPPPRAISAGRAALLARKAPVRFTASVVFHQVSSRSTTVPVGSLVAAQYIRTSRPPSSRTAASTSARASAAWVTSERRTSARPPPRSISAAVVLAPPSSTSAHTTAAPARANVIAVAWPMPWALPTTMATFPLRAASGMGTSRRLEVGHHVAGEQLQGAVRLLVGEIAEDEAADEVVDPGLGHVPLDLGPHRRR